MQNTILSTVCHILVINKLPWYEKNVALKIAHNPYATRAQGYKTISVQKSAEHDIFPAHKCENAKHFNIYEQKK